MIINDDCVYMFSPGSSVAAIVGLIDDGTVQMVSSFTGGLY